MPDIKLFSVADDGSVSMELDPGAKVISGIDALFQRVLLKFLKTAGTDVMAPASGGGLQPLLFGSAGGTDDPQVMADIAEVVRRVRKEVIEDQQLISLPASERLADLVLVDSSTDLATTSLHLTVSLSSEAGQTAVRTIGL